jgi:hypothetical protein
MRVGGVVGRRLAVVEVDREIERVAAEPQSVERVVRVAEVDERLERREPANKPSALTRRVWSCAFSRR